MSEATVSSIAPSTIYVRLLGEGTDVYRPAPAVPCGPSMFPLVVPEDYDPEDEDWEFRPGTTGRVERRSSSGGDMLVAVSEEKQP